MRQGCVAIGIALVVLPFVLSAMFGSSPAQSGFVADRAGQDAVVFIVVGCMLVAGAVVFLSSGQAAPPGESPTHDKRGRRRPNYARALWSQPKEKRQ